MTARLVQTNTLLVMVPSGSVLPPGITKTTILAPDGTVMAELDTPLEDHAEMLRDLIHDKTEVRFRTLIPEDKSDLFANLLPEFVSLIETEKVSVLGEIGGYLLSYVCSESDEIRERFGDVPECMVSDALRDLGTQIEQQTKAPVSFTEGDGESNLSFFDPGGSAGHFARYTLHALRG